MTKKGKIKEIVRSTIIETTVSNMHFQLTGVRHGIRWASGTMEVSKTTVRNALNEMATDGELQAYYRYGHCYDEVRYRLNDRI